MIKRIWESPTIMSWGSLISKMLGILFLLPIVLNKLPPNDTVLWFIFFNLISFQMLFDLGFSSSFVRIISYALSGIKIEQLPYIKSLKRVEKKFINWHTIFAIDNIMHKIYYKLSLISLFIGITIVSIFLYKPIINSSSAEISTVSWIVVLISSAFLLYSNKYISFLQGLGYVALVQRWSMIANLLSIITTSLVLLFDGSILMAIIVYQVWPISNSFLQSYFKKKITESFKKKDFNYTMNDLKTVRNVVWSSAWRSGVGVFMSIGIIQISGVIYSNLAPAKESVQYLFSLQLIRAISSFSQAPFYSKIPIYSKLYAAKELSQLRKLAKKSMRLSFAVYIMGFGILGIFGNSFLELVHSKSKFPSISLWVVLGLAILIERYGAMHIQLYSITNHIIWHKANTYTGISMIVLTFLLFPFMGIMAFAVSVLISYLFIYAPYVAHFSYNEFNTNFYEFEKDLFIPTLIVFFFLSILMFYIK